MNPKFIKLFNQKDNIMKNFDTNAANATFSNVGNQETSTREFSCITDYYPWSLFLDPNYVRSVCASETSEEVTPSEASPEEAPAVTEPASQIASAMLGGPTRVRCVTRDKGAADQNSKENFDQLLAFGKAHDTIVKVK